LTVTAKSIPFFSVEDQGNALSEVVIVSISRFNAFSKGECPMLVRRLNHLAMAVVFSLGFLHSKSWGITIDDAVAPPPNLDGTNTWLGVGRINIPGGFGSGTLIDDYHVLTAAHVVSGIAPANIMFTLTGLGEAVVNDKASAISIPTGYTNPQNGMDIAVITLSTPVPANTTTWTINSGQVPDETNLGLVAHLVGYGNFGNGTAGAVNAGGSKREATNQIDRIGTQGMPVGGWTDGLGNRITPPPSTLVFDFDKVAGGANASNLTNKNDPLGANGALLSTEGDTAPGDSGGPTFEYDFTDSEFVITGVHSFGSDNTLARYGDIGIDTQVQPYAAFIAASVPEPGSLAMVALTGVAVLRRRPATHRAR
jgi:secreted trypsin-like serine protease